MIKKIVCQNRITCVTFSRAAEGISVNAVAAGLVNGVVRSVEIIVPNFVSVI